MTRHITLPGLLLIARAACAQAGPVFHWPLDESSGTVVNETVNGADGQALNGVLWDPESGRWQGAARFNEVSQRILLGACDITTGGTGFNVCAWVKTDWVTGEERTVIAKTVGTQADDHIWSLSFVNGTALRFRLKVAGVTEEVTTSPMALFGGVWHHLSGSYDGSTISLYLNGTLMASKPASGAVAYAPQAPASIGAQSTGALPFSGWVDDVYIHDRALDPTELFELITDPVITALDDERTGQAVNGPWGVPAGEWTSLTVLDPSGRIIQQRSVNGSNTLDLHPLSSGMYMVCLRGPGAQWTRSLFVP